MRKRQDDGHGVANITKAGTYEMTCEVTVTASGEALRAYRDTPERVIAHLPAGAVIDAIGPGTITVTIPIEPVGGES